jgi:NTP pyrophosphatase (non-canonical NTP hydrolase)
VNNKDIINYLVLTNKPDYTLAKAAEECQELGLVLNQKVLKPTKVDDQEIIDEIGDVIIRLRMLKKIYSKKKINERISLKLKQFEGYINEDKYIGGI